MPTARPTRQAHRPSSSGPLKKVLYTGGRRLTEPQMPTNIIEPRAVGTSQKPLAEMQTQNDPVGSDAWQRMGPDCPK